LKKKGKKNVKPNQKKREKNEKATAHAYYTLINKKELNRSVQFDFIFVKIE
jgi:hypothetical protein